MPADASVIEDMIGVPAWEEDNLKYSDFYTKNITKADLAGKYIAPNSTDITSDSFVGLGETMYCRLADGSIAVFEKNKRYVMKWDSDIFCSIRFLEG